MRKSWGRDWNIKGEWSFHQRRKIHPKKSTQNQKDHLNKFIWAIPVGFLTRLTGKQGKARTNFSKRSCKRGVFFLVFRDFGWVFGPLFSRENDFYPAKSLNTSSVQARILIFSRFRSLDCSPCLFGIWTQQLRGSPFSACGWAPILQSKIIKCCAPTRPQKSANLRKRAQTQLRKRAQKALMRKNCKQPGSKGV